MDFIIIFTINNNFLSNHLPFKIQVIVRAGPFLKPDPSSKNKGSPLISAKSPTRFAEMTSTSPCVRR
jgi:hypothetical protein